MKNTTKHILAALLAASMTLALGACGGGTDADQGDTAAAVTETTAAPALTEDEYKEAVTTFQTDMTDIQTSLSGVDMTDPDVAKAALETLKQPFNDFMAVVPPDSYKDAHAKMQTGCQSMLDYIDTVSGMVGETDQTKLTEAASKMQEQLTAAATDMAEGAKLLDEAAS